MAFIKKLDLDKLKDTLGSGVQAAQNAVSNIDVGEAVRGARDAAASKAAEVGKVLESGVGAAQEGIANFNAGEAVQAARDAAKSGAAAIGKAIEGVARKASEEEQGSSSLKGYIALLRCLAYVDGEISDDEKSMFDDLSRALDESYDSYSDELAKEFDLAFQDSGKEFGYHNAAKIEAQKIIETLEFTPTDSKLICWNMLALANSDGLDEAELDFIRFVSEKTNVDLAVFAEFKNYSDAIVEIERSIEALKQSGRSYGEIEPLVAEFAKREQAIVEAAQSLVADE